MWKYFSLPTLTIYFSPTCYPTHNSKSGSTYRWETINNNPLGPIKLCNQSTIGVRLSCAYYQPQHYVNTCLARTILLSQTFMFWLFFIQFFLQGHILNLDVIVVIKSWQYGKIVLVVSLPTSKGPSAGIWKGLKSKFRVQVGDSFPIVDLYVDLLWDCSYIPWMFSSNFAIWQCKH